MASCPQRNPDLHWGRVPARPTVLAIRAISPVRAVPTRGGIIRIEGARGAARAVHSITAVETAGAAAAGEIRVELVVIPQGNVEFRAQVRMAGHRDGDMRHLPVTDPGITGRNTTPFLLAVTTLALIVRSFHKTLPWPAPSVCNVLPSGSVSTTTSGDFSPGAMPGPLGRLACIDVMGTLSRCIFQPSLTCKRVHPPSASSETIPRQAVQTGRWADWREVRSTEALGMRSSNMSWREML
jgi:hypothetical protein